MDLKDLLWAYQNQIYRQTHTNNLPVKLFERFLYKVDIVEQQSQANIRVHISAVPFSKELRTAWVDIADVGAWVCTDQHNGWLVFTNYTSLFQAEMVVKGKADSVIVKKDIPKPIMDKYDLQKEKYIAARHIKEEYLKLYPEDEGYVRQKDIVLVLNDHLRQQDFSARNTRLVQSQPKSFDRVIEIIKKVQAEGLLVRCEKYFKQRGKLYGENKDRQGFGDSSS